MHVPPQPLCPVGHLPSPFYEAILYVSKRIDAPVELVVADAFAVTSTVTQRFYKVRGINGHLLPTTLNTLSLAPTAVGKGESYREFFQSSNDGEMTKLSQSIDMTIDDLLLQDVSLSPLMSSLAGYAKSASIQLEDGYSFLHGPLMKPDTISKLPQAWSGPPSLKVGRHHGSKEAVEPCLAIGLRIQPELFYDFLRRDKSRSRHLGLWPRFLTFCHDPLRFPTSPVQNVDSRLMTNLSLMERLNTLLLPMGNVPEPNESPRKIIMMDIHAHAYLREIAYWIKGQMHTEFHDIQDAAGRAAENTLRLASNFHIVCQGEGSISREMIERAWAFVYWSLTQFRNVFVHALQPPPKPLPVKPIKLLKPSNHQQKLNADMRFVLDCIAARSYHHVNGKVPQSEIALLTGFPMLRFVKTLGWLHTAHFVQVEGNDKNATVFLLAPQHINASYGYVLPAFATDRL
jgi:hypothetical protein